MKLYNLFVAATRAALGRHGGIPLASLPTKARAQHQRLYSGSNSHTYWPPARRNGAQERNRRLAFKERHGHFASDTTPVYTRTEMHTLPQLTFREHTLGVSMADAKTLDERIRALALMEDLPRG